MNYVSPLFLFPIGEVMEPTKEDKPQDPFFQEIREKTKQAKANTKLRELLAAILSNRAASLSRDETIAHISLLPEQYQALCTLTGIKPTFRKITDGSQSKLCAGSEAISGPNLPVQKEGDEPGENSPGNDPVER